MTLSEKSTTELHEIASQAKADIEAAWRRFHEAQGEINRRATRPARERLARLDDRGRVVTNPPHPALAHEERGE